MDTTSQKVTGYRQLTSDEIDLINSIKQNGNELGAAIDVIEATPGVDKRALAIAQTNLQTGLMWLVRAIARPEGF